MAPASVKITKNDCISRIDDRLFGSFIEHLGRAVYGGIYEPGHETSDSDGFRTDVLNEVKGLDVPLVRYPGGNFVSSYFWEDGVGPKSSRKKKLDPAWRSVETNEFGTDEFMRWCEKVKTQPLLAVNLGTRGLQDAINYLEYCNVPEGTYYSDLRKKHGREKPYDVKMWCLGNEMDGKWQTGHKTASEYASLASKTGKAMKAIDPSLELVVCGSTNISMATFPSWEEKLLEKTYETADYISAHIYMGDYTGNMEDYMASTISMENSIKQIVCTCDYAKIKNRQKKDMMISFDEWGVWYHSVEKDKKNAPWQVAPPLLEEGYNFADALAIGAMVISLIRNSDRVKIGCLAQLVNVIAPIMTETGGGMYKQTIFYPYEHALKFAKGSSLNVEFDTPYFKSPTFGEHPSLDMVASADAGGINLFVLNKDREKDIDIKFKFNEFETEPKISEHILYSSKDPYKTNSLDSGNNIVPEIISDFDENNPEIKIPSFSWNVIRFKI